jgi:hypothetical protein
LEPIYLLCFICNGIIPPSELWSITKWWGLWRRCQQQQWTFLFSLFSFEAQWQTQHDKPLTPPPSQAHLAGLAPLALPTKGLVNTISSFTFSYNLSLFQVRPQDKIALWLLTSLSNERVTQQIPSYLPSLRISIIPNIILLQLFRIL